jgi:hypothetical protein
MQLQSIARDLRVAAPAGRATPRAGTGLRRGSPFVV